MDKFFRKGTRTRQMRGFTLFSGLGAGVSRRRSLPLPTCIALPYQFARAAVLAERAWVWLSRLVVEAAWRKMGLYA
uniref:Uncharacterized protein n=1 Tax=Aegilops tauschii subsp. strangulata TaxID=200361 RepID=A0A453RUP7_AEGTS